MPGNISALANKFRAVFSPGIKPRDQLLDFLPKRAVCAEIGVWKGTFSARILKITNPKKLHLIDPWKYQTEFGWRLFGGKVAQSQEDMDVIYNTVLNTLGQQPVVSVHRNFSSTAAAEFQDDYFDWIYIDGNHYYTYVLEDLNNYFSKVKRGGYIAGDDYYWTSEELDGDKPVKRAVQDFVAAHADRTRIFRMFGGQFVLKRLR